MMFSQTLDFIHQHSVGALATTQDQTPSVRMVWTAGADHQGVLFHTSVESSLHRDLSQNPRAEICFVDQAQGQQIRLRGTCEVVTDSRVKDHLLATRDFLRALEQKWGHRNFFQVYKLKNPEVQVWTMASLGQKPQWKPWGPGAENS